MVLLKTSLWQSGLIRRQATPILALMPKSVNTTPSILETKNIFTSVLDQYTEEPEWQKDVNGMTWVRLRKYGAARVVPIAVQLVVPPKQTAPEWLGPTYVIGEDEGTAVERLSLTQREVRERSLFSKSLGRLVHKSWRLTVRSELQDIPAITGRDLTAEEREEHRHFGGSQTPSTIAALEPSVDLVLGYEESWYVGEGAELSPRIDPESQIGRLVLNNLHETSVRILQGCGT